MVQKLAETVIPLIVDVNGHTVSIGSSGKSWEFTATGEFQAVIVPVQCKRVKIICRSSDTGFNHVINQQEFHIAFNQEGLGWVPTTTVELSIYKPAGFIVAYVRGPVGLVFACSLIN